MDMISSYTTSPVSFSHVYVRNETYRAMAADMRRKAILHFLLLNRVPFFSHLVGFDDDREVLSRDTKGLKLYSQLFVDKACNVFGRFYNPHTKTFSRRLVRGNMFGVPQLGPEIKLHPRLQGYARVWASTWNILLHKPILSTVDPLPPDDGIVVPIDELDGFDFDTFITDVFGSAIGTSRPRKEYKVITQGDVERIRQWADTKRLTDMVDEIDYVVDVLRGYRAQFKKQRGNLGKEPRFKKSPFGKMMKELTYLDEDSLISRDELYKRAHKMVVTANAFRANLNSGNLIYDHHTRKLTKKITHPPS